MGIIARLVKSFSNKNVVITGETRKNFNSEALLFTPSGDDSIPIKGERLVLVKVDGSGKYVTVGVLTPSQGAKPGEKILFARNNQGRVVNKLSLLNDGTVNLESDGKIFIGNRSHNLAMLLIGIIEEIEKTKVIVDGNEYPLSVSSIAQLQKYKFEITSLLKDSNK